MQLKYQVKDSLKAWDEACSNCCITRGWNTEEVASKVKVPFRCVHRETLNGKQLVCAAMKDKLKEWLEGM